MLFPNMETESLKGDKFLLPGDLNGSPALIMIFMKAYGQVRLLYITLDGGVWLVIVTMTTAPLENVGNVQETFYGKFWWISPSL